MKKIYESWGRFPKARQEIYPLFWQSEGYAVKNIKGSLLPYGLGRSYGDVCLNDGGTLIDVSGLDRFISFDEECGILRCEAGASLKSILDLITPKGWFLPVVPGTQYVTLGGAIANDIHGKNHHREGTFGRHVKCFELLRSNGERMICSPGENKEWYEATIGGLGLTGVILWAEIKIKKISSPYIHSESIPFENLDKFFDLAEASDKDFEYTVAWIDCLAKGSGFGRGVFIRGNHAEDLSGKMSGKLPVSFGIPFNFPEWVLNPVSLRIFNRAYYARHSSVREIKGMRCERFFFPLDAILNWNLIYGKRGLLQYQCVVPKAEARASLREILSLVSQSGFGSFLNVLKVFGDKPSPGMLSFPSEGVTLAMDFPNYGKSLYNFLAKLTKIVRRVGGRLYPAKDAMMGPDDFEAFFPRKKEWMKYIDPRFSSGFWRRVSQYEPRGENQ